MVFLSQTGEGPSTWDPAFMFWDQGCALQPRWHIEDGHPGRTRPRQRCWSVRCRVTDGISGLRLPCLVWGQESATMCLPVPPSCLTHLRSHGAAQPDPHMF